MVYRRLLLTLRLCARRSSNLSYVHAASSLPLLTDTIDARLRRTTECFPDKELFVFKQQQLRKTYAQVYRDAWKLAKGLTYLGLKRGDRVGIWSPNYYEWTVTQFASAMAGFILVNLNPAYEVDELKYALKKVGVKALISPRSFRYSNYYQILRNMIPLIANMKKGYGAVNCSELPDLKHLVIFNDDGHGVWRFNEVIECGGSTAEQTLSEAHNKIQFNDPTNIEFTSGTTGRSKAVVLSHHNIVNNANFCGLNLGFNHETTKVCVPNPLFHCFGCIVGVVSSVIHAATCVFPSASFNSLTTLRAIADERCTTVYGTPTMFVDILSEPTLPLTNISSATTALIAGSFVAPVLLEALMQRTSMHNFVVGFGCTELTTAVTLSSLSEPPARRMYNAGRLTPHLEMCIMNDKGEVVTRGVSGEVCVRGYSTMLGYWDDAKQTCESFDSNRWFHMGDVGFINDDENLVIVGRIKDMIIRGGENIYPAEIESQISKHPLVKDVQVIGIPDERLGEEVCAVVQLVDNGILTEDELKAFCHGKLAHFRIPRYIMFKTRDYFPLTSSGKIKKNVLSQKCYAELHTSDNSCNKLLMGVKT